MSDIALKGELPPAVAQSMAAYVGCIAGAIQIDAYREGLLAAGFEHVEIVDSGADLNAYAKVENQAACCSPSMDTSNGLPVLADVLLLNGQARHVSMRIWRPFSLTTTSTQPPRVSKSMRSNPRSRRTRLAVAKLLLLDCSEVQAA